MLPTILLFFISNIHSLGYDKFYFIPILDIPENHIYDTVTTIYKLDTCFLYNESVSVKYKYYNDSHIELRQYFDNLKCEENYYKKNKISKVFTYLTHLQDYIDKSYIYQIGFNSITCTEPYIYNFFNNEHCNIYDTSRFYYEIKENSFFRFFYIVQNGNDLNCYFNDTIFYSEALRLNENECVKNGEFLLDGLMWKINHEKQNICTNGLDDLGLFLTYIFIIIILI